MTTQEEALQQAFIYILEAKEYIRKSEELLKRFQNDQFPHTPLMPMYKRPEYPPDYC